jgi:isocitrate/isopropylmalate dehydrogenase
MSKYKIAWLPGDGVGNDVMEAARIVLDALKFGAEYNLNLVPNTSMETSAGNSGNTKPIHYLNELSL